jgi:hypothetical protein
MQSGRRSSHAGRRASLAALIALSGLIVAAAPAAGGVGAPTIVIGTRADDVPIGAGPRYTTVATLRVPHGSWWIRARTHITFTSSPALAYPVIDCKLVARGVQDRGQMRSSDSRGIDLVLQAVQVFGSASGGVARVRCRSDRTSSDAVASSIRLAATSVGKLTNRLIGTHGTTVGTGAPRVIAAYRDTPATIVPSDTVYGVVGRIALPPGLWQVEAKAQIRSDPGPPAAISMPCRLTNDLVMDERTVDIASPGLDDRTVIALAHPFALSSRGTVRLECLAYNAFPVNASRVKLTAFKAGRMETTDFDAGTTVRLGAGAPVVRGGIAQNDRTLTTTESTIASLHLSAGSWSVQAFVDLSNTTPGTLGTASRTVFCHTDGDPADASKLMLFPAFNVGANARMVLEAAAQMVPGPAGVDVHVACFASGTGVVVTRVTIVAFKAGSMIITST